MNADITIELLPDARCHVTIEAEARFETGELPIADVNLNLRVSSPSSEKLKFDVTGSVTFTQAGLDILPEDAIAMLTTINADVINLAVLSGIEGKYFREIFSEILGEGTIEIPSEIANIRIDEIRCTKFSWSEPTIEAGLTTTLSGSIFERNVDLNLEINLTAEGNTTILGLTFDGYFDLPRVGDNVQWNFEMPEIGTIPILENFALENLGEFFEQYNINFTLKVPENASVSGLPSNYYQADDTYTWSGSNAAKALGEVLTGEAQPDITYKYEAPFSIPWLAVVGLVIAIAAATAAVLAWRRR